MPAAIISTGSTETVSSGGSATGDQIGDTATVDAGATVASETVQARGTLVVSIGAVDSASTVLAGGSGTVLGLATGDQVYGTQLVSGATAAWNTLCPAAMRPRPPLAASPWR